MTKNDGKFLIGTNKPEDARKVLGRYREKLYQK